MHINPIFSKTSKKKRRFSWIMAHLAALAALALFIPGKSSDAGIKGSAHDFSALSENQEICIFCHTPHEADVSVTEAPLWNHTNTTRQFQVYNSPTLDATVSQPSGASKLCLSCHDGSVAVDSFGGKVGVVLLSGDLAVGDDGLMNDHPISFTYDDALAATDGELFSPSSSPSGMGRTIREDLLFNSQMECSSCHDVHNGPASTALSEQLLVITQAQSQLCFTCHDK